MKFIYVAHPYTDNPEENRRNAAKWCAQLFMQGFYPIADWIILTGELEETPENRRAGLEYDKALISRSDAVVVVGGKISSGMQIEMEYARERGIPVFDFTHLGYAPTLVLL